MSSLTRQTADADAHNYSSLDIPVQALSANLAEGAEPFAFYITRQRDIRVPNDWGTIRAYEPFLINIYQHGEYISSVSIVRDRFPTQWTLRSSFQSCCDEPCDHPFQSPAPDAEWFDFPAECVAHSEGISLPQEALVQLNQLFSQSHIDYDERFD